ncbi:MAG: GxxExxY protein [Pseudomonadota bacterium]|nr:GxxExxY protein [Pseudomonadota bacterium]
MNGILFKIQQPLPVIYKDIRLDCGYRIDLFIENKLIVELKSVEGLKGMFFNSLRALRASWSNVFTKHGEANVQTSTDRRRRKAGK